MKKRVAKLLVALGMLATASASVGCIWWAIDESNGLNSFLFYYYLFSKNIVIDSSSKQNIILFIQ